MELLVYAPLVEAGAEVVELVLLYMPVEEPAVVAVVVSEDRVAWEQPLSTRPNARGSRIDLFIDGVCCSPTDRAVPDRFAELLSFVKGSRS